MCLFVQYYGFTQFALLLNEIDDNLRVKIAPTDSRLRPDMRRMEEGDFGGYFLFYMWAKFSSTQVCTLYIAIVLFAPYCISPWML